MVRQALVHGFLGPACLFNLALLPAAAAAQPGPEWLLSESGATGDADLKLDMAAAERSLAVGPSNADVQQRLIKEIRAMLRSYPGKNRLFDSANAPAGAVDVTVPFLDLVQFGQASSGPEKRMASTLGPAPAAVGSRIAEVAGAVWADRDNDGRVDGFVLNGQYYAGRPAAVSSGTSAPGSASGIASASSNSAEILRQQRRRQRQEEIEREFEAEQAAMNRRLEMERRMYESIHSAIGNAIQRNSSSIENENTATPSLSAPLTAPFGESSSAAASAWPGNTADGSVTAKSIAEQEQEAQEFLMRRQQQWDAEAAAERAAAENRQRSFQNAFQQSSGVSNSNQSCGADNSIQVRNGRQCVCHAGRTDGWNPTVNLPDC